MGTLTARMDKCKAWSYHCVSVHVCSNIN